MVHSSPGRREEKTGRRRWLTPMGAFTLLAIVGIIGMSLIYVTTGFVLDDREQAFAETLQRLPDGESRDLSVLIPGHWTDACVLNTQIADPGKTKKPPLMPGMLIPPMRHHATFLKGGYWLIVTLDAAGDVLSEIRVDPDHVANLPADNGGNFCAPRKDLVLTLSSCSSDCRRKVLFARSPR